MNRQICLVFFLLTLVGCGGGGSSSTPAPVQPIVLTGVFVDSPVAGLSYSTPSRSGVTNAAGEFQYEAGETVSFRLGNIELGSAPAAEMVTPIDLIGANSFDEARQLDRDDRLVNMLLLLQSLDRDGNPDNGLDLTGLTIEVENPESILDVPTETFTAQTYQQLVNLNNGRYLEPNTVINHLLNTLNESVTVTLPIQQRLEVFAPAQSQQTTNFEYDTQGRLITITTDFNRIASITYNNAGDIERIIEVSGTTETLQTFTYDASGRVLTNERSVEGEVFSLVTFEYDDVGNLLIQTTLSVPSVLPAPLDLYTSEFIFGGALPGAFPLVSSSISSLNPNIRAGGSGLVVPVSGTDITGVIALPNTESVTTFTYLEDGTISEIQVEGTNTQSSITTLDEIESCYEFTVSDSNVLFLPALPQGAINGIPYCGSELPEVPAPRGRSVIETNTESSNGQVFNSILTFDDARLVEQVFTIASPAFDTVTLRTAYTYDEFGNLTRRESFRNNTLESNFTREYERRVLAALP